MQSKEGRFKTRNRLLRQLYKIINELPDIRKCDSISVAKNTIEKLIYDLSVLWENPRFPIKKATDLYCAISSLESLDLHDIEDDSVEEKYKEYLQSLEEVLPFREKHKVLSETFDSLKKGMEKEKLFNLQCAVEEILDSL